MAATNDFQISLGATLDSTARTQLDKELKELKDLAITVEKAQLSNSAIQQIRNQLSNINLDLKISNSGDITAEITRIGQEAEESISNGISKGNEKGWEKAATTSQIKSLHEQLEKLNATNTQAVQQYQTQIQSMIDSTSAGTSMTVSQLQGLRDQYIQISAAVKESDKAYNSNQKAAEQAYGKLGEDAAAYEYKILSLVSSISQWGTAAEQANIDTTGLQEAFIATKDAAGAWAEDKSDEEKAKTLVESFQELELKFYECQEGYKYLKDTMATDTSISNLHQQILNFVTDNDAALGGYTERLSEMLSATASGATLSKAQLQALVDEFKDIETACGAASTSATSFLTQLSAGFRQLLGFSSIGMSLRTSLRVFNEVKDYVVGLDTALIDLRKTTTMTNDELMDFYYESNDIAKQMGVTTEEIINQAAAWSRLGYSTHDEVEAMAALSSQFAQISPGMGVDEATDGLIAIMKAYDVDVSDVLDGVMSKVNSVGNTAATTNEEIVAMLERSSSAMSVANNSFEETVALETAAVEVTRNAANVGTIFRTIAARLRGYDEELDAYVNDVEELSGKIADLTKTASTPGGISLFTDADRTEYKSTYQLFQEISEIWDELTDKDQAALLETMAGKRLPDYTEMYIGTYLIAGTA